MTTWKPLLPQGSLIGTSVLPSLLTPLPQKPFVRLTLPFWGVYPLVVLGVLCYITIMENNKEQMNTNQKVYAVIGGYDYEGEVFRSLRLFDAFSSAQSYSETLKEEGFDYVKLEVKDIFFGSTISHLKIA